MPVKHITHTGPCAGQPVCGTQKGIARERGDDFAHTPYSGDVNKWVSEQITCEDCRAAWWDSFEDD